MFIWTQNNYKSKLLLLLLHFMTQNEHVNSWVNKKITKVAAVENMPGYKNLTTEIKVWLYVMK